jgi:hypothetical protein
MAHKIAFADEFDDDDGMIETTAGQWDIQDIFAELQRPTLARTDAVISHPWGSLTRRVPESTRLPWVKDRPRTRDGARAFRREWNRVLAHARGLGNLSMD